MVAVSVEPCEDHPPNRVARNPVSQRRRAAHGVPRTSGAFKDVLTRRGEPQQNVYHYQREHKLFELNHAGLPATVTLDDLRQIARARRRAWYRMDEDVVQGVRGPALPQKAE